MHSVEAYLIHQTGALQAARIHRSADKGEFLGSFAPSLVHFQSSVAGVSNRTVADAGGEGNAPGRGPDGRIPAEAAAFEGLSMGHHGKGHSA